MLRAHADSRPDLQLEALVARARLPEPLGRVRHGPRRLPCSAMGNTLELVHEGARSLAAEAARILAKTNLFYGRGFRVVERRFEHALTGRNPTLAERVGHAPAAQMAVIDTLAGSLTPLCQYE